MADNYLSGKSGGLLVGGLAYSFGKWKCPIKAGKPKVSNWTTAPYEQYVSGLLGAEVTFEGPYNQGNMPLTAGNTYTLTLQWTNSISLVVTGILDELTPDNDAEAAPRINCHLQVSGTFTAAIT